MLTVEEISALEVWTDWASAATSSDWLTVESWRVMVWTEVSRAGSTAMARRWIWRSRGLRKRCRNRGADADHVPDAVAGGFCGEDGFIALREGEGDGGGGDGGAGGVEDGAGEAAGELGVEGGGEKCQEGG